MKNLRAWAAALAVTIFVAGAAAVGAQGTGWLSLFVSESSGAVQSRGLDTFGKAVLIGQGTASPTAANSGANPSDGEFYVVTADSTAPSAQVYDETAAVWNDVTYVPTANLTESYYFVPGSAFPTSGAAAEDALANDLENVVWTRQFHTTSSSLSTKRT